MQPDY